MLSNMRSVDRQGDVESHPVGPHLGKKMLNLKVHHVVLRKLILTRRERSLYAVFFFFFFF